MWLWLWLWWDLGLTMDYIAGTEAGVAAGAVAVVGTGAENGLCGWAVVVAESGDWAPARGARLRGRDIMGDGGPLCDIAVV